MFVMTPFSGLSLLVHLGIISLGSIHDRVTSVPPSLRYRSRRVNKTQRRLSAVISFLITFVLTLMMIALFTAAITASYEAGKDEWQRQKFDILINEVQAGFTRLF